MQKKRARIGDNPNEQSATAETVGRRKEQFEKQELEKKNEIESRSRQGASNFERPISKHQSQAIGAIIERVKETYGRH